MYPASTAGRPGGPQPTLPVALRANQAVDDDDEAFGPDAPARPCRLALEPWPESARGRVHLSPATARAARRIMARQSRQRLTDADAAERSYYMGLAPGAAPAPEVVARVCRAVSS